jgi:hypothetical protein
MNFGMALRQSSYISDLFPRHFNLVTAGVVYGVTYGSAAVAAASATSTGSFALFNPAGSGVQLVLLSVTLPIITFTAGTTGAGFGFQFVSGQQPTTTTAGNTPQNALIGSSATSVAKTYTVGTLVGAPTVPGYYSSGAYMDLAAGDAITVEDELAGKIVVAPNSGICIVSSGTLVANLAPSLMWAELPQG